MWLALLPGGREKKETKANTLPWKCWKRKLPSIKKVTKFPHCINRFQYSKRWGWGRGGDYVQGPIEKKKRSSRTLALQTVPTGALGGAPRAPEFPWPPGKRH